MYYSQSDIRLDMAGGALWQANGVVQHVAVPIKALTTTLHPSSRERLSLLSCMTKIFIQQLLILVGPLLALQVHANSEPELRDPITPLVAERVWHEEGIIWGMAFITDDQFLLTLRDGRMKLVDLLKGKSQRLTNIPEVFVAGQGGLLDVMLDRDFTSTQRIYWTYSKQVSVWKNATALATARLVDGKLVDVRDVMVAQNAYGSRLHYGSRIAQDTSGHLFWTLGERYSPRDKAQQLDNHFGKVLRLNNDGSVPADNPFVGVSGALPEIWSYGHRNPQGLAFDSENQVLYLHEHGPQGGDEINIIKPGRNYGWPVITYGEEYGGGEIGEGTHKQGMEQPIKYYVPSIAPSGLAIYRGSEFPQWDGDLFLGALAKRHLNHVVMRGQQPVAEHRYFEGKDRVRCVVVSPSGYLFFTTDRGDVLKLSNPK